MLLTRRLFRINTISCNQVTRSGSGSSLLLRRTSRLISWDYIKQFHLNPPLKEECVYRSLETQLAYEQHRQTLATQGITIKDYIISKYFKCPKSIERGWNIVPNNFPLHLSPDIQHLVIWMSPQKQFSDTNIVDIIEKYMAEKQHHEYIYYRNIPERRSIPTIDHMQIFVRE